MSSPSPSLWTVRASSPKPIADYQPSLLAESQGNPLEEFWSQRLADGRLPEHIAQVATLHTQNLPEIRFEIVTHLRLCKR